MLIMQRLRNPKADFCCPLLKMTVTIFLRLRCLISNEIVIINFVLGGRAWHNYNYYQSFLVIVIITKANIYSAFIMDVSGPMLNFSKTGIIIASSQCLTHAW